MSIYGSSKTCCANICQLKTVRLASTENIVGTSNGNYFTINNTIPYTIDGVEIALGDLILLKDQSNAGENGVYVVTTLENNNIVLTRYCNFNAKCCNYKIYVSEGDTFANTLWYYIQNPDYNLSDPINFIRDDGSGGDITNAANVGGDVEVFKQKNGSILEFRTLTEGTNITITQNVDTITFDAIGDINSASNLGAGAQVFKQKVGNDLQFRTLVAGANVVLTQNADTITITASGGGGGGSTGRSFNLDGKELRIRDATPILTSVFSWDQSQYSTFTSGTCTFYAIINDQEVTVSIDDALAGNLGSVTTAGTGIYAFGFTLPVADTYFEIYTNHDGTVGTNYSILNGLTLNFYE